MMLAVGWRTRILCRAFSPVETPTIGAACLVWPTAPSKRREVNSVQRGKVKLAYEVDLPGAVPRIH